MCKIYIFMIDKINRKGHLNKKTFKRLIAIVMATTTMAVGFGGMSVSAVYEKLPVGVQDMLMFMGRQPVKVVQVMQLCKHLPRYTPVR